jgi:hypothetical protein
MAVIGEPTAAVPPATFNHDFQSMSAALGGLAIALRAAVRRMHGARELPQ